MKPGSRAFESGFEYNQRSHSVNTIGGVMVNADATATVTRLFLDLPDVLIQDPVRACAYRIPRDELARFRVPADEDPRGALVFVIPDDDLLDELVPATGGGTPNPDVVILHQHTQASFRLSFDQLRRYATALPIRQLVNEVAFAIPPSDLIEELPGARASLLQSSS